MNIDYNGISYFVNKDEMETKNSLIDRTWYIAKFKPSNSEDFKKIQKKSKLFNNIKNLGCRYNKKLEESVNL